MDRRGFLGSAALAALGLAGCTSAPRGSGPADRPTPSGCAELEPHPIDLPAYDVRGYHGGFELTASRPRVPVGGELTVRLRNTAREERHTGNDRLYAVQRAADGGWEHLLRVTPEFAWTEEARVHPPGEGFEWTMPVSTEGLTRDGYTACTPVEPGVYRFVYWGMLERELGLSVAFAVGPESAVRAVDGYETHVLDHAGIEGPVVPGGLEFDVEAYAHRHHVGVVTDATGADRFDLGRLREVDRAAAAFVEGTDFGSSFLVAFQEFPKSSSPDYAVTRVERSGRAVHLHVDDASMGGTADVTVETVLVRVPLDGAAPPTHATVTTEDGVTYSTH